MPVWIASELVSRYVGFLTIPSPTASLARRLYAHMSTSPSLAPGICITANTSGRLHEAAALGCSRTKCLPCLAWISQSRQLNRRSSTASLYFLTHSSLPFCLFRYCRLLNIVHGGESTSTSGLYWVMSLMTRAWFFRSARSHFSPLQGSTSAMSMLQPLRRPRALACGNTRGGEKISLTSMCMTSVSSIVSGLLPGVPVGADLFRLILDCSSRSA